MTQLPRFAVAMLMLFALTATALTATAQADTLLAGFDYTGTLPNPGGDLPLLPFVAYGDPGNPPAVGNLDGASLTFIDFAQGNSYELTGDLVNFASLAANGVDDSIYVGFGINGVGTTWSEQSESTLLSNAFLAVPGLGAPDFAGYEITRVLVLGSAYNPGVENLEISFNFEVYGDRLVPEPGTWAMLLIGAAALVAYRRIGRN